MTEDGEKERLEERTAELERRLAKLEKINAVLMDRVECGVDSRGNAYSLFQTAIGLERQVKLRTEELTAALRRLAQTNDQLLLAKDMAERANRSKTRFLAQAGHDLFQPLGAAKLAAETLAELQGEDRGRRLAQQIGRSLAGIEEILRTLLDISRLDAGTMLPKVRAVAVGQLLANLADDYGPAAARRGIELRIRGTRLMAATDPAMLARILQNLVCNALRYTERGRVLVGVRRREESLCIDVLDTGPGIPKDQHASIFEEFHRGHGPVVDAELGPGLGLGLSIVQRLVGALGHRIALRSEPGRGTCFSIEMPRASAPPALPEKSRRAGDLSGACVLVIDDNDDMREAIAALVEGWGCLTLAAADRRQAMQRQQDCGRRPDLLLVDYHLEEETAIEAIGALRSHFGEPLPALVVTADDSAAVEARVAAAGLELVQKPVRPAELRALTAHLLRPAQDLSAA